MVSSDIVGKVAEMDLKFRLFIFEIYDFNCLYEIFDL